MVSKGRRRIVAGIAAIADQALTAGSNFLINLILIRMWPMDRYGVFAGLYAGVTAYSLVHNAIVTEPLMVLAGRRNADEVRRFNGTLFVWNALISAPVVIAIVGCGIILSMFRHDQGVLEIAWSYALGMLGISIMWFGRRAAYASDLMSLAVAGGAIYAAIVVGGLMMASGGAGAFGLSGVFRLLGLGGAVAGLVSMVHVLPALPTVSVDAVRQAAKEVMAYGKWALSYSPMGWFVNEGVYIVLPAVAGFDAAGVFRAVMNVVKVFQHVIVAVGAYLLAELARVAGRGDPSRVLERGAKDFAVVAPFAIIFSFVIWYWAPAVIRVLYGPDAAGMATELRAACVLPLVWTASQGIITIYRALGDARTVSWAFCFWGAVPALVFYPIASMRGALGAILAHAAITLVVIVALLLRMRRQIGRMAVSGVHI